MSPQKKKCCIKNCITRPTRCINYIFYCRNHFMKYIIAHTIISKKLKKRLIKINYKKC